MKDKIFYNKHNITSADIKEVIKTLKYQKISKGKQTFYFAKNLRKFFKSKYCLLVSSGTAAQIILAKALNWKKRDHVLLSPLSFASGANSILLSGATPVFVDINLEDYNLDYFKLEKKLKELKNKKKRVKAIISTDYAGIPANWKKLKKISKKYNLTLINDNCHALGSKYIGKHDYALKYADYIIQSFHAVKNVTTGEGGALLTNNLKIYKKAQSLSEHGFLKPDKILSPWDYEIRELPGYNFRISDINCSLGNSQLRRIHAIIRSRRKIAKEYNKLFANYDCFKVINENRQFQSSYHLYPLTINFAKLRVNEKKFYQKMKNSYGIHLQKHYTPTYRFKIFKKKFNLNVKNFKNTEYFYKNTFSLPLYLDLKKKKILYIFKSILNSLNL